MDVKQRNVNYTCVDSINAAGRWAYRVKVEQFIKKVPIKTNPVKFGCQSQAILLKCLLRRFKNYNNYSALVRNILDKESKLRNTIGANHSNVLFI